MTPFQCLKELVSLIENLTKIELKNHIEKEVNISKGQVHILKTLGYFHSILTPNAKNDNEIIQYLKHKFNISIPNYTYDDTYFFEYRRNQNETPSIALRNKIFSMRECMTTTTYKKTL